MGRIILLGSEKVFVKKLGSGSDSIAATFVFLGLGSLNLAPYLFFIEYPPLSMMIYPAASAVIYSYAFYLYVKSLSLEDASLVSPLYNFNVFFLLLISVIFLGDGFGIYKVGGIVLLFYGSSFLNKQSNILQSLKAIIRNPACLMMITCSLLVAVGRVIDGYAVRQAAEPIDPIAYGVLNSILLFIYGSIIVVVSGRVKAVIDLVKERPFNAFFSGFMNAYSYLLLIFAFRGIDVSVAEPASMLSTVITVVLAKIFFKEIIGSRLIGVAIMIVGIWFLFM